MAPNLHTSSIKIKKTVMKLFAKKRWYVLVIKIEKICRKRSVALSLDMLKG